MIDVLLSEIGFRHPEERHAREVIGVSAGARGLLSPRPHVFRLNVLLVGFALGLVALGRGLESRVEEQLSKCILGGKVKTHRASETTDAFPHSVAPFVSMKCLRCTPHSRNLCRISCMKGPFSSLLAPLLAHIFVRANL
jgi:hypothetical protein